MITRNLANNESPILYSNVIYYPWKGVMGRQCSCNALVYVHAVGVGQTLTNVR